MWLVALVVLLGIALLCVVRPPQLKPVPISVRRRHRFLRRVLRDGR